MNLKAESSLRREKKVKSILISQNENQRTKQCYEELEVQYGVTVEFHSFIKVQPFPLKYFLKQKVTIPNYTAIIFTSKKSIDYFFDICQQMKIKLELTVKYFCTSEAISNYLNKYVTVKKRKMFCGKNSLTELARRLSKYKKETFLYPCSSTRKPDIVDILKKNKSTYKEVFIYETVSNDLKNLNYEDYDLFAFFSPSGIKSLFQNFPEFQQRDRVIAAFGKNTAQAVKDHGLQLQIQAPHPNAPSMTAAIENYIKAI